MEISLQNSLAVVAVAVVVAWIWSLLEWVWFSPKRLERRLIGQQGIGGHPYRLFHGDMKDVRSMGFEAMKTPMPGFSHAILARIRPFLHRSFINHGKVCVTWEGPVPVVNVAEAELVKQILSNHWEFQKPNPNPLTAMLVRGVVSYDGPKWAHHRKLINPAFHMEKLKLMVPAFYTCCGETLSFWDKKVSNGEHEIDVCSDLTSLSADSISRAAFGSSYKEGRRIFQLIRDQIFVTVRIAQSVYFPGRRYLPTEENKKMKAIEREIRSLLKGIIDKRKTEEDAKDDLLGLLMDSHDQNDEFDESKISKQKTIRITTDELIDECKLFYLAGQETTSTLLMWTLILLSKHQDWQAKARQEVLNVFGTNKPEFDGLNHLKTMNIIFHEVLRLYPPVVELRRRIIDDNTRLGNLTVPKGALLNLSVIHIHHDPLVWGDDVNEFNPERFSQGISHASKGNVSFLAFGWGPRICIGSNFAMIEAKMALSMILQRFSFELSPSYVHAPSGFGILRPQFGAPIVFNHL